MFPEYQIRADYDRDAITIYQAYSNRIAEPALKHQRFVPPFSLRRMTWIKPSFLWLMYRSNWAQKSGQPRVLAIRIKRTGWEKALSLGVLTHPEPKVYPDRCHWEECFRNAHVHIQWDTERSIRGAGLNRYSIQVGISRHIIHEYVDDWILSIDDLSPKVAKIRSLIRSGKELNAKRLLPQERPYPVSPEIGRKILIG